MFVDVETGRQYRWLGFIWGFAPGMLLMINVLSGAKLVQLGPPEWGLVLAGGTVFFPITYIIDDMITEVYGFQFAKKIIWTSFALLLFAMATTLLVAAMPSPVYMTPDQAASQQDAFDKALGLVPRVSIASILAVLSGRFVNSWVMTQMKVWTKGKYMGTRFVLSTVAGEAVDTLLFVSIAFLGTQELSVIIWMCVVQYTFKVLWEIVALPISLPLVAKIKSIEHVDHFGFEEQNAKPSEVVLN